MNKNKEESQENIQMDLNSSWKIYTMLVNADAHKYSVSAMCRVLQVNRSTYYYEAIQKKGESELVSNITEIFKSSRNNYGTRKIKKELLEKGNQEFMKVDGNLSDIFIPWLSNSC